MDPDQARHFVRPDLDPKCLQRLSAEEIILQRVMLGLIFLNSLDISSTFTQTTLSKASLFPENLFSSKQNSKGSCCEKTLFCCLLTCHRKTKFPPYIQRYTFQNENFENSYPQIKYIYTVVSNWQLTNLNQRQVENNLHQRMWPNLCSNSQSHFYSP